jgi:DNA invertase Pin-like site-specific DNA recombinase
MQRIGVYARVSTARQAVTQSTDQQVERLRAHVAAHGAEGWELQEEHVFRDDGFSGARLQRPGLDRLHDAVAAAALDRVLVTAPDRLARNYVQQMVLLEELERHGCQVDFLQRPMSQDPHDQLLLQIRSAVAALRLADLRLAAGPRAAARSGRRAGGGSRGGGRARAVRAEPGAGGEPGGLGQAPLHGGNAHHIVQAIRLQPREEGGAPKATVGQDDGADAVRQGAHEGKQRLFFEQVLALVGREMIAVVGHL